MREIDLAVAWEWPYDAGFMERLLARAAEQGRLAMAITQQNLNWVLDELAAGRLRIRRLLDRAADEHPAFRPLGPLAEQMGARVLNRIDRQERACDKARNHLLCAARGVPVPPTLIVSPFMHDPSPPEVPAALGRPFVVKPASGSGSEGVVLDACSVEDVQHARRTFWADRYLLQQRVQPSLLDGRRAWFRVFYVYGQVIPCWWDDLTHIYAPLCLDEETRFGLVGLRPIVRRIARVVGLDFFTSEIVLASDGRLLCVDYANAPCDLRLQSQHPDGVPDGVIDRIVDALLSGLPRRRLVASTWGRLANEVYS